MNAVRGIRVAARAFFGRAKAARYRLLLAEAQLLASTSSARAFSANTAQVARNYPKHQAFHAAKPQQSTNAVIKRIPFATYSPRAIPRNTHQVGLNTARNFSSTQPILGNLMHNVPLALRASVNSLDEIENKSSGQLARRVVGKGKGKAESVAFRSFTTYNKSAIQTQAEIAQSIDTYSPRSQAPALAEGVRFILPVEPIYEAECFASPSGSKRLLNQAVLSNLQHITQAQNLHSNRIRSLADRLQLADLLEGHRSQLLCNSETGEKRIVIDFHPSLQVEDLRQAVGWEQDWFEIVEPNSSLESSTNLSTSLESLVASEAMEEEEDEQVIHDATAQSFVLPRASDDISKFLLELEEMPRPFV